MYHLLWEYYMKRARIYRAKFLPLLAAIGFTFYSCTDDVYDPNKKRDIAPAENPFGSDFQAPSGFDWSMMNGVSLTVEVKDIYNGSYEYLIEVFKNHPSADTGATPLAVGYANGNHSFTTTLSLPANQDRIYIRKTSPRMAKEIYEYPVATRMVCKLYREETATRTLPTPSQSLPTRRDYSVPNIPEDAQEWEIESDEASQWKAGDYILEGDDDSRTFRVTAGSGVNLYVKERVELGSLTLQGGSTLTILGEGALILSNDLNAQSASQVSNFGILQALHTDINT